MGKIKLRVEHVYFKLIEGKHTQCTMDCSLVYDGRHYINSFYSSGYAFLKEGDAFDERIGQKIAAAKAMNLAYRKAKRILRALVEDTAAFLDAVEDFNLKADKVRYKNRKYIKKF